MIKRRFILALIAGIFSLNAQAAENLLAADHPDHYTVVKGDTLWDIASYFLRSPWRWPDIWQANQQIANPHLIYPGDELVLVYINGEPKLRLKKRNRHVKLSPGVRSTPWDGAIPTIPIDAIAPFLSRPYVVNENELDNAPYIVAFADDRIVAGAGQKAYVRNFNLTDTEKFDIVRPGDPYKDADTDEVIGYEALYIGSGQLSALGEPATLFINSADEEVIPGDRLLPAIDDVRLSAFLPAPPDIQINGSIIDVHNGVSSIGQYNVVVLDRGANDGLKPGTVLRVDHKGPTVLDKVTEERGDTVTLPDEKAGILIVFRTFERVSFGLIMNASRALHVLDRVRNP